MPSPHIIDIRWRIASEEKAKRMPPAQPPFHAWYARKLDEEWGIVQHIPDCSGQVRFKPTTQAEFDEVNSRYRDDPPATRASQVQS